MMMLGGRMVPLAEWQAHHAPKPAAAVGATVGQGLTVGSSTPDPGALSDDERQLIWQYRANKAAT